ncbi:hypothetical protein [Streptomyces sp. NPDC051921]|uniref:hypothetical protein n=1 Tax=Streptomyces sp. NPDC051921 TaxID=3155806 RepID=UPI00343F1863
MTRIARGLAGAALALTLATTTACGGSDEGSTDGPTETTDAPTTSPEPGTTLFPGRGGGQSAPVHVPTAKVNEPTYARVPVHFDGEMSLAGVDASTDDTDSADASANLGTCTGTLSAGEDCEITLQVTAYEPGPYSGVMTVETSDGETLTVPFSGEAVGGEPTETVSPTTEPPTPTETEIVPTESEPTPEIT